MSARSARIVVLLSALQAACAVEDRIAVPRPDAAVDTCPMPVTIPAVTPSCSAALAEERVRVGLCTCTFDVVTADSLVVDAFDSRLGAYDANAANAGGSLGTRGNVFLDGPTRVTGNATVMGPAGLVLSPTTTLEVGGELAVRAPLFDTDAMATVIVAGDTIAGGALRLGTLEVFGDLYRDPVPADFVANLIVHGDQILGPIEPASACECDVLDVSAIVSAAASQNENATIGLEASALTSVASSRALALSCGRFYLDAIHESAPSIVTIEAAGHVALFVGGDVDVSTLVLTLAPGATLDVFVTGTLDIAAGWQLGDAARPSALRIYSSQSASITLGGDRLVAGLLHVPNASVSVPTAMHYFGALVAREVDASAPFHLHQDLAFDSLGSTCVP
jgi:hypothetical protein